jgi:predicted nucleic acid-binding protein
MKRIYLDTNILVVYYSNAESNKEQKKFVLDALSVFSQLNDVELWTSMWAVTEMVKVLVLNIKMDSNVVSEFEKDLLNESRLANIKIHFADVSPLKNYDFKEFFYHIRRGILSNGSGVGDNIHSIVMKNNGIEHLLTFDIKDFENIAGITVLHPKDVKI